MTTTATGAGVLVEAHGLSRSVADGVAVLQDVSLTIRPGELVGIVGGSGAGKTTLLEAMAAIRPADAGTVTFDGVELYRNTQALRSWLGYVPQEDIIHADLPLARTLVYAARLRLPPDTPDAEIRARVEEAMQRLDLHTHADVRVGALSGGQRKRASIAVELLTEPRVFFLDEPTSGLDPETAAELLALLRRLADAGTTIVFTTHAVADLERCDRVTVLARGGHLAFTGTVEQARSYFEVDTVEQIYGRLANEETPDAWAARFRERTPAPEPDVAPAGQAATARPLPGPGRQWAVLTARTFETLARNRLTMAILLGSPAMIVAMFAILFRPGAFAFDDPSPSAILMIVFWVVFGAFFFGLTYGLLQIVGEQAILRREHLAGMRLGPYLLSKVAVLMPFLVVVTVLMLGVLRALDRLPQASATTYLSVGLTLTLVSASALTLGLLTSAAVSNPAQATLALPLLCFPAVLFSGAILPVHLMAGVGAAMSLAMPVRWGFEAVGVDFEVRRLLLEGGSPLGPPLVETYGDAGMHTVGAYWLILAGFTVAFFVGAWLVLRRTAGYGAR